MEFYNFTEEDFFLEVEIRQEQLLITVSTNQKHTFDFTVYLFDKIRKKSKIKGLLDEYEIQIINI